MKILAAFALSLPLIGFAQSYTISGYIKDAESGENLIGATIYDLVSKEGTSSNIYGFYSLTLPADSVRLRFTYVGYEPQMRNFYLQENTSQNVRLLAGNLLEEVVVTAEEAIENTPQMSRMEVGMDQVKLMPALLGEQDILKSIQLLPGIQTGTEGSSGLYVRGGGPDQNLILLDGVPVYNASHLFGFFSVFNPDAINKVSVMKGGFPSRYGGRLSSVIDISMKEGNNQKLTGSGSIGIISSKLTLEGPLANEKTSFIISGRRTYIDLLARPIIRASTQGDELFGYYFYDLNAKINHTFSDHDRVYLSVYTGDDKSYAKSKNDYYLNDTKYIDRNEFGLQWGNIITAARWNHLFSPRLFSNLTTTFSKYRFSIFENYMREVIGPGINETSNEHIEYSSGIADVALRMDFDYLPNPGQEIRFGAMAIRHRFNPGVLAFASGVHQDTTLGSIPIYANEFSAYAEDDLTLGEKIRINAGLHGSLFYVEGRMYPSIQPRISARVQLPGFIGLKASYAEMTQFIHLLTNASIGLPTDLWVPATRNVLPQQSRQWAAGLARTYGKYEISLEGYYKTMQNLIEYKDGASYFNASGSWQDKIVSGQGESYGLELFAQKKTGKINGWVGYSLSRTTRQFDEINFGRSYPYKYDRRHDVSIVGIFDLNEHFQFSSTWVYGSGNAITMPQKTYGMIPDMRSPYYFIYNNNLIEYGGRNSYRMRAYHRLDLSMTWTKEKDRVNTSWSAGAYNLYNRKNPFFIDLSYDADGNKKFIQYSLFPLIPFVKYSFEF
ncbi:MAG: TonB-dependent receptor [Cyclobacteriaceae bacterium]|nr:TonB-dependent receptor [Cyclobacteriaceae bacterium]